MVAIEYSSTVCMHIIGYFIFNVVTLFRLFLESDSDGMFKYIMDLQATIGLKTLRHNRLGLGRDSDGMFNITREHCLKIKCLFSFTYM